ncbi:MAG: response regulator transcription factor [Bacteroidetes bacterium]|nr:response regulator transcription factor [Bacteroidota bacterium]
MLPQRIFPIFPPKVPQVSSPNPIKVALTDDHKLFRKGMIALLEDAEGMQVLFEAGNGIELLQKLSEGNLPDVILLDITMPEMDGIAALQRIRSEFPTVKVVMLTMNQDDAMILHLIELGANGYLLKESDPDEVEMAIRAVMETGFYFNDRVSRAMLSKIVKGDKFKPVFAGLVQLTDREVEILDHVCRGLTNPEIGDKLFISARTVEGHRQNIMEKMGVRNTAGMIIYAIKKGWVALDEIQ